MNVIQSESVRWPDPPPGVDSVLGGHVRDVLHVVRISAGGEGPASCLEPSHRFSNSDSIYHVQLKKDIII